MKPSTDSSTHRSLAQRIMFGGIICHVANPNVAGAGVRVEALRRLFPIGDLCENALKRPIAAKHQGTGKPT